MSAGRVTAGSAITWQQPMRRFEVSRVNDLVIGHDTRSLYFLAPNPDGPAREINVVVNWLQEALNDAPSPAEPR